ncbi:phospho-N-acetylmuramoyl-pentapeptide-transferase [Desulfurispirillum indicum S5]|uniref:Phospho-N-acetylmuramoyl-pentapeptide-transferase n=1 Tax=Desulfurispirillum indicum (strain ATCC BAA-1389 / DSM 22839 / S5) TaxID=653733 RepID=E6W055_DESIS|nr:phospho-N-acetylmuramoyl-pentapeptide-transferase [Desulfurispirillum indicum]ADU65181.1 phospho-N-acetylmuramoyl-pentapeptide-transferase [Desulfurispirillum indicum S5]
MLYNLLYPMAEQFPVLNVFRYITFRAIYAAITALLLSFLLGPSLIAYLRNKQFGQVIRTDGPQSHSGKRGTPTMGGILIIFATVIPTLLWADLKNMYVWLIVLTMVVGGLIGLADDLLKIFRNTSNGLSGRKKLLGQCLLALFVAYVLYASGFSTGLNIPFYKQYALDLGLWFIPFAMLVIVGSSNAVNLTDGLDGLAIGAVLICAGAFAVIVYATGHAGFANYLLITFVRGVGELTIFLFALCGAGLGFLWYNSHPAEIFMGDVGSLSIGASLGAVAVMAKQEILLAIIGGLFVLEALSVIIQVASFKLTGKRVFRMAPIHHHFELGGLSESKVIVRLWTVAIILALVGLSTLKMR